MDYVLIAALIILCLSFLAAAAAAGYLTYEALTKWGRCR